MPSGSLFGSIAALRRKLRAVAAMAGDPAATPHERAAAQAAKARLEQRLKDAGVPAGDWTDAAFRLGKQAAGLRKTTAPGSPGGDWTDTAHRLGRTLRRGWKRWLSE